MKKIAFIFVFIFSLLQVLPAVAALCDDSSLIFLVDEEKGDEKKGTDQKAKKEFLHVNKPGTGFNNKIRTAFSTAEKLYPPPFLVIQVPPPDLY